MQVHIYQGVYATARILGHYCILMAFFLLCSTDQDQGLQLVDVLKWSTPAYLPFRYSEALSKIRKSRNQRICEMARLATAAQPLNPILITNLRSASAYIATSLSVPAGRLDPWTSHRCSVHRAVKLETRRETINILPQTTDKKKAEKWRFRSIKISRTAVLML